MARQIMAVLLVALLAVAICAEGSQAQQRTLLTADKVQGQLIHSNIHNQGEHALERVARHLLGEGCEDHAESMHTATDADPHTKQPSWLSQSAQLTRVVCSTYQDLCTTQPQFQVITCHDWAA